MEIQINYHLNNMFLQFESFFKEVLEWTINRLQLKVDSLTVILTNDSYLCKLHKQFFNLDNHTDVITFNLGENSNKIEGEIYISVDRAIEQSKQYKVNQLLEIGRLIVHGCLHLAGFDDKTKPQLSEMKTIENDLVSQISKKYNKYMSVEVT